QGGDGEGLAAAGELRQRHRQVALVLGGVAPPPAAVKRHDREVVAGGRPRLPAGGGFPEPQDPVVGGGGVRDVGGLVARHVAVDATVLRRPAQPLRRGEAATVLLVA